MLGTSVGGEHKLYSAFPSFLKNQTVVEEHGVGVEPVLELEVTHEAEL